jgi:hypothetical protein
VTGQADVAPIAKILKTFAAEFKIAALKVGVVDKSVLSTQDVEALADLPPREVLLAQLLGLLLSPMSGLARLLNEPGASLARLLQAKADQQAAATHQRQLHRRRQQLNKFRPARESGGQPNNNCPGWRRLALILRKLSEAAIRRKTKWRIQTHW